MVNNNEVISGGSSKTQPEAVQLIFWPILLVRIS